jgi:predicted RNA-binding Zn-ribbon protein involved in translation (DUF1610 family)
MSQVSEIKCPHCGEWSQWTGKVDAKCVSCGQYIEPVRFVHDSEKKLAEDTNKKKDFYVLRDSDETITQLFKMFVNSFRFGSYYVMLLFVIFIAVLITIFGLLAA